ncbi:MAG: HAD family phosphatase [Spirochaetales bacterium]|nr:HAD family phosphatase [Spirochaetales bacterium]
MEKHKNGIYRGCLRDKISLVAFDLDGTLINSGGRLSDLTRQKITELRDIGVVPVLCTGRLFRGAVMYAEMLGITAPLALMNGALIRNRTTVFSVATLDPGYVTKTVRYCRDQSLYYHVYIDEYIFASAMAYGALYYNNLNKQLGPQDKIDIQIPSEPLEFLRETRGELYKIMIMSDRPAGLEKARIDLTGENISITSSWPNNIEIFSAAASKGNALRFIARSLGIADTGIAACGDNTNDIDMLKASAFGIAMGNAVPELKKTADYITGDNNHDGVAGAIAHLFAL